MTKAKRRRMIVQAIECLIYGVIGFAVVHGFLLVVSMLICIAG